MRTSDSCIGLIFTLITVLATLTDNQHVVGHATHLTYGMRRASYAEISTSGKWHGESEFTLTNHSPFPARDVRLVLDCQGDTAPDVVDLTLGYEMQDAGAYHVLNIKEIPARKQVVFRVVAGVTHPRKGVPIPASVYPEITSAFWPYGDITKQE
jgi:hypothetical protein